MKRNPKARTAGEEKWAREGYEYAVLVDENGRTVDYDVSTIESEAKKAASRARKQFKGYDPSHYGNIRVVLRESPVGSRYYRETARKNPRRRNPRTVEVFKSYDRHGNAEHGPGPRWSIYVDGVQRLGNILSERSANSKAEKLRAGAAVRDVLDNPRRRKRR